MAPDARMGRVVAVALDCLGTRGYARTTLQHVGDAADVPEAEVRQRFGGMEDLLGELVAPLVQELREAAASAARADLRQRRELARVMGTYVDTLTRYRPLAQVVLCDEDAASTEPVRLVRTTMLDLRAQLFRAGGTGAALDRSVRAASAMGAVEAAVLELGEADGRALRDVIADAAVAILLS